MAELVDALASGASDRMVVEVQVLFWAPNHFMLSPFHEVVRCSGKYDVDVKAPYKDGSLLRITLSEVFIEYL